MRRYKSEQALSLGTEIATLGIAVSDSMLAEQVQASEPDLKSITRAKRLVTGSPEPGVILLDCEREDIQVWIVR